MSNVTDSAFLAPFRHIAAVMLSEPANWQWIGKHLSQRHFGITETRAKALQAKHGGQARPM